MKGKKMKAKSYPLGKGVTTSDVEKPFKIIERGLDFGKPKKVKKSFSSAGMRF